MPNSTARFQAATARPVSPRLSAMVPSGGEDVARGGLFGGQFAEGGVGAGQIAIGQPQIGQHDTRGERRQALDAHLRRWSVHGRQGKRNGAAGDAGTQVTLDG